MVLLYLLKITNGVAAAASIAYKAEEDINSEVCDQLKFRLSYGLTEIKESILTSH